jgi:hypothetical protein
MLPSVLSMTDLLRGQTLSRRSAPGKRRCGRAGGSRGGGSHRAE